MCPTCQKFPGDNYVNDDFSKGTKDHLTMCPMCGRLITNWPVQHIVQKPEFIKNAENGGAVFY